MDQDDITQELMRSFDLRMTSKNLGLRRQDGMMKLIFADDEPSPVQQSAAFGQMVEAQEQFQPKDSELPTTGEVLEDIGEVAKGAGRAVLGGMREAGQGFLDMTGELGELAEGVLPAGYVVFDEQGLRYTSEKPEDMQQLELPEVPKGDSVAENLARGAIQFAAGMAAAPVRGLGYGTMMLRSGFADALFDPEEGNLATAINELGLGNEFTELIDSKVGEDATAAERLKGRLGQATEGAITGAIADAVIGAVRLARGDPELKETIKRSLRPVQEYAAGAEQRIAERRAARGRTLGAGIDPQEITDPILARTVEQKKPTAAELRRQANIERFGYDPNEPQPQPDTSYRIQHQPRGPEEGEGIRLDDLTKNISGERAGYPEDFYTPQGQRVYAQGPSFAGDEYGMANQESYRAIKAVRGKPDAEVTIYRAVPDEASITTINPGDFVTLSRKYAELHGASGYGRSGDEPGKILEQRVKVSDIYWDGNDVNEFGYFPESQAASTDFLSDIERKISEKYPNVQLDFYGDKDRGYTLSKIILPKDQRNMGRGSEIMSDLIEEADKEGAVIKLSPSKDFGATSVNRLKQFYKRFGFVENKGRNKDLTIKESMYRKPNPVEGNQ